MKFGWFVFFLFLPLFIHAKKQGQAHIDSLLIELPKAKEDTNKVKILNDLSISFSSINPGEGLKYGRQALDLSTRLDWKTGIGRAYSVLGTNYTARSEYNEGLECDLKSLKINEEIGNKYGIAAVTNNIGLFYQNQGDYPKALEYYFKALKINEEMGYENYKAANLSNIGEVYAAQNNYPIALDYDFKALKLFEGLDNKNGVSNQLENIGTIYSAEKDYSRALEYYFKALSMNEETGRKSGISACQASIGNLYVDQRNYPEAIEYFLKALKINEELGNKKGIAENLGSIGEFYLEVARDSAMKGPVYGAANKIVALNTAIEYLKKSITLCKEIGDLENIGKFSLSLSESYTRSGNYKEALDNYRQYIAMRDSVFSMTNNVRITNMETDREIALKNKQIQIDKLDVQKKRNERVFFIAGIGLLLLVIVFVVRNYYTQKNSNKLLSAEMKRSDDLLLNILPAEVANELKNKGTAPVKHFDNVTVMFTDFVNFTQAGERLSPQDLIDELHMCFKTFDEIVTKYNIEKIKTIGDAYLAVCGLPAADPHHAENIMKAAIEINAFMSNRQKQLKDKTFEVRIGVNSGSVVAGIVGVKKFAYDIWGDTVNTAARMEEYSAGGKINISQATYELVKDRFNCEYRGEIKAKNKGAMKMYFVS